MPAMIVAPQPIAVEEGAKVLAQGGNAVDAAVACAFVQGVVDPQMCGLGGYLILNLHRSGEVSAPPTSTSSKVARPHKRGRGTPMGPRGDLSVILDAPALAGSKVTPTMWEDRVIGPNPDGWGWFLGGNVNDIGYTSICTPGAVRGLSTILTRWGTWTWPRVLEPAIRIAEEGYTVTTPLAMSWKLKEKYPEVVSLLGRLQAHQEARRLYLKPDGSPYDAGEVLRNPDYGRSLRRLAEHGPDDFYTGELARQMAADLAAGGSFVTAEDLSEYQPRDAEPLIGTYRGHRIVSSPPPHGGPTLLEILNILEGYDLASLGHNSPDYIHTVAMAMKAAFADRNANLGDPSFVEVPLEWMISKDRAAQWREVIHAGRPIPVVPASMDSPHTTHVSAVDGRGQGVALTHSLGSSSGVITPGLGFMYNNSMINFHPYAGHPNSMAPRKGRTSGMTPTIVYRHEKPWIVIGAPGATRIITAIAQVLINVIDFGMSIQDAVLMPRFDCQGEMITCHGRIPEFVCEEVRRWHPIGRLPQSYGALALVHAVMIDPTTGELHGAADPGAGGMPLAV